jgi:hypothetical protein
LAAVRFYVRLLRDLVRLGQLLIAGGPVPAGTIAELEARVLAHPSRLPAGSPVAAGAYPDYHGLLLGHPAGPSWLERMDEGAVRGEDARAAFAGVLSALIQAARPTPAIVWHGARPQYLTASLSPLLTMVFLQIADLFALLDPRNPDRFVTCSNPDCERLIDTAARRRAPLLGQKTWCDECRAKGVHKRDSERRLKANQPAPKGG